MPNYRITFQGFQNTEPYEWSDVVWGENEQDAEYNALARVGAYVKENGIADAEIVGLDTLD